MNAVPDMATPQIALKVIEAPAQNGSEPQQLLMMQIETAVTHYEFMLCTADNYIETANKIADGIMTMGKTMKKKSSLQVVREMPDALRKRPQQRK